MCLSLKKEDQTMSSFEQASALLEQVPESKIDYVIAYLQGIVAGVPSADREEVPNAETIAAMQEGDEMIRTGKGEHFTGSTSDFLASILAGED
jgi:hypothetical protein